MQTIIAQVLFLDAWKDNVERMEKIVAPDISDKNGAMFDVERLKITLAWREEIGWIGARRIDAGISSGVSKVLIWKVDRGKSEYIVHSDFVHEVEQEVRV